MRNIFFALAMLFTGCHPVAASDLSNFYADEFELTTMATQDFLQHHEEAEKTVDAWIADHPDEMNAMSKRDICLEALDEVESLKYMSDIQSNALFIIHDEADMVAYGKLVEAVRTHIRELNIFCHYY